MNEFGSAASGTSRSLLEGIRGGDAASWDRLVNLYAPLVMSWCRQWGLPHEDAADVFQETFAAVARNIGEFRKQAAGDTFRGWLRTIARNKLNDHFRKRAGRPVAEGGSEALQRLAQVPEEVDASVGSVSADPSEAALFRRAMDLIRSEFEDATWNAFWRTVVDGKSASEAATELSMSPGAVRVAKSRVLRRLREELGDAPG